MITKQKNNLICYNIISYSIHKNCLYNRIDYNSIVILYRDENYRFDHLSWDLERTIHIDGDFHLILKLNFTNPILWRYAWRNIINFNEGFITRAEIWYYYYTQYYAHVMCIPIYSLGINVLYYYNIISVTTAKSGFSSTTLLVLTIALNRLIHETVQVHIIIL